MAQLCCQSKVIINHELTEKGIDVALQGKKQNRINWCIFAGVVAKTTPDKWCG